MKLPVELDETALCGVVRDAYWGMVEAIVRDCAKTARDHMNNGKLWPETAILARYGLEP